MAHEESSFGRFLKDASRVDRTRASVILAAAGKTLAFSSQQRIQIREPLIRLYKDIETFQYRAVTDTLETIEKMESARTAYRAGLLWMKDVSQKLDPDTYRQLEKFRRVQAHVRRSKMRFERIKIDTHQKIDMLSASRVNLFSHSLALYQKGWLAFFEKTSQTMNAVSEAFTGFQYYEFNILKELRDPNRKAIDDANYKEMEQKLTQIFGEEPNPGRPVFTGNVVKENQQQSNANHISKEEKRKCRRQHQRHHHQPSSSVVNEPSLLDMETTQEDLMKELADDSPSSFPMHPSSERHQETAKELVDILSSCTLDEKELLSQIFTETSPATDLLTPDQQSCHPRSSSPSYLPSQLLADFSKLGVQSHAEEKVQEASSSTASSTASSGKPSKRKKETAPLDKWLNLFAEIDPLSNPDAIGREPGDREEDRNC